MDSIGPRDYAAIAAAAGTVGAAGLYKTLASPNSNDHKAGALIGTAGAVVATVAAIKRHDLLAAKRPLLTPEPARVPLPQESPQESAARLRAQSPAQTEQSPANAAPNTANTKPAPVAAADTPAASSSARQSDPPPMNNAAAAQSGQAQNAPGNIHEVHIQSDSEDER